MYSVLSDPLKRRDYDEYGEDEEEIIDGEEAEEGSDDEAITLEEIQAFLARVGSLLSENNFFPFIHPRSCQSEEKYGLRGEDESGH